MMIAVSIAVLIWLFAVGILMTSSIIAVRTPAKKAVDWTSIGLHCLGLPVGMASYIIFFLSMSKSVSFRWPVIVSVVILFLVLITNMTIIFHHAIRAVRLQSYK